MSGLGWTLRRLRAMGPAEIAHRTRVALLDRFGAPAHERWPAALACERLFEGGAAGALATSRLGALVRALPGGADAEALGRSARELGEGRWRLFSRDVTLADPPDWNANPLTGARWPAAPTHAIDPRRTDLGGAKYVWEQGRLAMLPDLALAARLTGEAAPRERALRWLDDFAARNPLGHGIHHASGIEQAIRVQTLSWTLALLGPGVEPARVAGALGLIAQQALALAPRLSVGSSANNHLIAEYGAMVTAGALFPSLEGGERLLDSGLAGLEREVLRQFHRDGVLAEQAFGYVPFVWELLLTPFLAAGLAGRPVAAPVRERLARSLEFARAIRLEDGEAPRVGDLDDGLVLLSALERGRLDLVGNALAAWLGADALSGRDAMARLTCGAAPPPRRVADGEHGFPDGGWTVWRYGPLHVTFDHGPLGLGPLAAHGHADALAVTVHWSGAPVVLDPGMPAYHEDPATRDRFRSTPWHSTVSFGGRSQAELLGPFLWGRRARVVRDGDEWACTWPTGERHRRGIVVRPGEVAIRDRVEGAGAELVFMLPDGARLDGAVARVPLAGGQAATLEITGTGAPRLEPAGQAPRFGVRLPAKRLVAPLLSGAATTSLKLATG